MNRRTEYIIIWILIAVVVFILWLIWHPKVLQYMFDFMKYP